jgi:hypothetical protein
MQPIDLPAADDWHGHCECDGVSNFGKEFHPEQTVSMRGNMLATALGRVMDVRQSAPPPTS